MSVYEKKMAYDLTCLATGNCFFECRIVVLRLLRLNIKARHEIPEFLNAYLWSIHLLTFDIDLSWNIFTLHNFCSTLIKQLIDLEKLRTKNLKFRTYLQDRVMDGWSVTQQIIVYKDKLLKYLQIENWTSSSQHWSQDGFQHSISFATNLTANFGCYRFRITLMIPDVISKLLRTAIWSRCAVQFESEQTPFSRTGHWLRSAALYRIVLGTCGFVLKGWAKQWALLWTATTSSQFHWNFLFHM